MRLATLCLASCSGCHINLLSLQDEFLDLLAANDLVFSPILMDVKEPQACDLALIEGAVRTEEDAEKLRALRAKAQLLVAMGSAWSTAESSGWATPMRTTSCSNRLMRITLRPPIILD